MRPGTSVYELALEALGNHDFPGNIRELKKHRRARHDPERRRDDSTRPPALCTDRGEWISAGCSRQYSGQEHGGIGNAECRELLSVNLHHASHLLKKLLESGLIERRGTRRWSRYHVNKPSGQQLEKGPGVRLRRTPFVISRR